MTEHEYRVIRSSTYGFYALSMSMWRAYWSLLLERNLSMEETERLFNEYNYRVKQELLREGKPNVEGTSAD